LENTGVVNIVVGENFKDSGKSGKKKGQWKIKG
jgi:hypothetical protein